MGPVKLMAESLLVCAVHREGTFEPSTGGSVDVVQSLLDFPFKATLPLIAGFALPSFSAISVTSLST